MGIVSTNVKHRIEEEANKKTFVDEYGTIVGWLKVIADWVMAPIGAILDGMVIYSLLYLSMRNEVVAVVIAVAGAIMLQVLYGRPASIAAKSFFTGRYAHRGTKTLMWAMGLFTVGALATSLWLSLRYDRIVEKVGETKFETESETPLQATYDNKVATLQQQYQQRQERLLSEAKTLDADKIMWRGKWTTRERSSRAAAKIRREQLPALDQWYNDELNRLETQREQAVVRLDDKNKQTETKFQEYVYEGGTALKFINVSFNIARVLIILVFVYFITQAMEETYTEQSNNSVANTGSGSFGFSVAPNLATAQATEPAPDRTVVKPFSTVLPNMQHSAATAQRQRPETPATPVANTVTTKQQQPGNNYTITVVDGEPTIPWEHGREPKQFTLKDVEKYIGIYESRKETPNNRAKLAALRSMKSELENSKA